MGHLITRFAISPTAAHEILIIICIQYFSYGCKPALCNGVIDEDAFFFELKLYDEAVMLACTDADANHDVIWNGIRERLNQGFLRAIQKEHPRLPDVLRAAPLTPTTVQEHICDNSGVGPAGNSSSRPPDIPNNDIDQGKNHDGKNHSHLYKLS